VPGIPHLKAIRAFEKAGFKVIRQSKHIVLSDGVSILTIPRANPVNAYTLCAAIQAAGLTIDEFRKLV